MDHSPYLEELKVRVIFRPLPDGFWGLWDARSRTITVDRHLGPIQRRCTIFHELGHAYHGHHQVTPENELEADVYTARMLIGHSCWRHATAAYEDLLSVAEELSVTPQIAAVYAKHLARHPAVRRGVDTR